MSADSPQLDRSRGRKQRRRRYLGPMTLNTTALSDTEVELTWTRPYGAYVAGYKIFRDNVEIHDYPEYVTVMGETIVNEPYIYVDNTAVMETTYTYSIQAYNNYGGTSPLSTSEVTTLDP